MQVVKMNAVAKESFEGSLFTGPEVSLQVLLPDSKEFNVNIVNFGQGVRNKFHSQDREQVLIVTSGRGYIATETERIEIAPGDVVLIPAGDKNFIDGNGISSVRIFFSRCGQGAHV